MTSTRLLLLLPFAFTACASSSASFATQYPTNDSVTDAIERGASRLGCHSETSFHGEDIRCGERSVKLIEDDGHFDAQCDHMSSGECRELLQSIVDAGRAGS